MGMNAAVAYIRCSTSTQAEIGCTLSAQEDAIRRYCDANGIKLEAVIVDAGVSGSTPFGAREGGKAVLAHIKRKRVSTIIATKLDRMFRDAADCLVSTDAWTKKGVGLVLLDLGGGATLDTKSPVGRLLLTVMAGVNEAERAFIGERTRVALQHKKAQGLRVSGKAPLGWSFVDGLLVEDKHEQEVLCKARALRAAGYSFNRIAKELNSRGVKSRGEKWYPAALKTAIAQL